MSERSQDQAGRRGSIVLGVTSSIAAYKAADLTSKLVQAGVDVHVVMTANAARLVQPQTFLTLSRNPVINDLWSVEDWRPEHIALADLAALMVVAPATANFLGKLAHGVADDALTTVALSHEGPMLVAPAMNPRMWRNPAVQENVRVLRSRGIHIIDPEPGHVACSGDGEPGRLADVQVIADAVLAFLAARQLPAGDGSQRVLVTAGPTREAIDPVRFIANHSSGRMGYALAQVAAAAGHSVVLISGPTALPCPYGVRLVPVTSAAEMCEAVKREFADCDLLAMCAAVSDFTPAQAAGRKIKKSAMPDCLPLARTDDILMTVASLKRGKQRILGFAAETDDLADNARKKLREKKLDWIAANDVSKPGIGFGSGENQVTLYGSDGGVTEIPRMSKLDVAAELLGRILSPRP
jgi:phosphopantothenoylcysteine decarboxylase/phosphopantothenate--cysteine ligase